ncbi:hypothetical protein ACQKNX_25600 [Lysinibacillus sp. NPDC093712]|uniref:hypothetical protein n=1 Tax=Lysinibacillus sp. NPDC093712 TaxID=3390579 RepID=UPI003CFE9266
MSFTTSEYVRTITVSKSTLENMIIAQNNTVRYWRGQLNTANFRASIIGLGATALGFVFKSTVAGVILTVLSGALTSATTSYKEVVVSYASSGLEYIIELFSIMKNNPGMSTLNWTKIIRSVA